MERAKRFELSTSTLARWPTPSISAVWRPTNQYTISINPAKITLRLVKSISDQLQTRGRWNVKRTLRRTKSRTKSKKSVLHQERLDHLLLLAGHPTLVGLRDYDALDSLRSRLPLLDQIRTPAFFEEFALHF
jgi:hypothetical protein